MRYILGFSVFATTAAALVTQGRRAAPEFKHVFMFSIDGLHASDVPKYVAQRPDSNIASLLKTGIRYPNAFTSAPSDSFPGTVAQFTGALPVTTGIWYDDTFDRSFFNPETKCIGPPGAPISYDESIDFNATALFTSIDPADLPEAFLRGACTQIFPHERLRVNTIFELVRARGDVTTYTDKHPSYDVVRGPSGTGLTEGFFPEINAIPNTVPATIAYDTLHIEAFLNWTSGISILTGEKLPAIPTLMGGNFQAVSVAQKTSGYVNATGFPFTAPLLEALDFVDGFLGQFVSLLEERGIFEDSLLILASKHGQTPIDPNLFGEVAPALLMNLTGVPIAHATTDDIALIFLEDEADLDQAVANLNANREVLKIQEIIAGTQEFLARDFGNSKVDPAVPDIIVRPIKGIIYTTSHSKIAEHGGLSDDDRNVALIVSNPNFKAQTIEDFVETKQVAVTALQALGIDPELLEGAKDEGTTGLPGLF
ncbi:type I phosphodiesterase/nucleotide pyrophosphatase [Pluteus cervinus]|uniref:Type I phosphodiesterase/nucleotide pyrophosphatase n=1 Tax=Pluteus cervinus TaxID=181527 RepID=A0ACD3AB39_9AGAR|nr:type I phosphodiesterase/nucleotide pyrophosphatase [Pluteus cervinus]